jgi:hypothetical protein
MTDRHTDRHTHGHGHTDTKFFIALSCSGTSITTRKVIKSGGIEILFFAWIQYFGILMRAEVIQNLVLEGLENNLNSWP